MLDWLKFRTRHRKGPTVEQTAPTRLDPEAQPHQPQASVAPIDSLHWQSQLSDLLKAGHYDAAETIAAQCPPMLQDESWFVRAQLAIALHRERYDDVLRHGDRLIDRAVGDDATYRARSIALRTLGRLDDAEREVAAGLRHHPLSMVLTLEAAMVAEANNKPDVALQHLLNTAINGVDTQSCYLTALDLTTRLDRHDLAVDLIRASVAAAVSHRGFLVQAARYAMRRGCWEEANACFRRLITVCPGETGPAMEAAKTIYGGHIGRQQRLPLVLRILDELEAWKPGFAPAYVFHARILREGQRLDEAARLLPQWLASCRDDADLLVEAALVSAERGDPAGALRLLRDACADGIRNTALDAQVILLLCQLGEHAEAEGLCHSVVSSNFESVDFIQQHVILATRRGDMGEAARRIAHWRGAFPANRAIFFALNRLSLLLDEDSGDGTGIAVGNADKNAELFARFESLGASHLGCEFGMVQKRCGVDPVGLLRWGNMRVPGLIKALQARFEGMGEAANTRITTGAARNDDREYFLHDDRYNYFAHTFIRCSEASEDVVLRQACRRMTFLRRKLIEVLTGAEKILVFKMSRGEDLDAAPEILTALRAYGPCTFFCAALEDAAHPAGTLDVLQPGLFVGRFARFGDAGGAGAKGIDVDAWRDMCERVSALDQAHAAATRNASKSEQYRPSRSREPEIAT